jgi:hypothetical protein
VFASIYFNIPTRRSISLTCRPPKFTSVDTCALLLHEVSFTWLETYLSRVNINADRCKSIRLAHYHDLSRLGLNDSRFKLRGSYACQCGAFMNLPQMVFLFTCEAREFALFPVEEVEMVSSSCFGHDVIS